MIRFSQRGWEIGAVILLVLHDARPELNSSVVPTIWLSLLMIMATFYHAIKQNLKIHQSQIGDLKFSAFGMKSSTILRRSKNGWKDIVFGMNS
jgi:hypothetical protein